jgi:hypothetical protein
MVFFSMRKTFLIVLAIVSVIFSGNEYSFAFKYGEKKCSDCHVSYAGEAEKVLKEIIPDAKILSFQENPIEGFLEVGMESSGKFYFETDISSLTTNK